ncbi:MAG: family protein phosphatase [Microbacteriaceae bacterium]|nr:serine/threonine-protein phosphatase [Microbacteriaceae bacterium]MDQ1548562.1 family protein phosphatase [Microbacteriaceae bacterium]MDQ1554058.1 family protein phosphatase [Microbacteriaceae bacterium]
MTEIGRNTEGHVVSLPGRPDVTVTLSWGAATDIGRRRKHNEDSFLAQAPIFVVADGMGGHASGDVASAAVVARLAEATGDFVDTAAIEAGLRAATADIMLADDDLQIGVGTTATGAAMTLQFNDPYWAVFNIGDSRVYSFERNELTQVTVDHSVVQELVDAGLIDAADAESHPDSNIITRAVGFDAEPMPDYWMIPIKLGLRMLLCSDGLTKEVNHERLRQHLAAGLSAKETASALIDAALDAGGRDNVTAIVVDVVASSGPFEFDTIPGGNTVIGKVAEPPESPTK